MKINKSNTSQSSIVAMGVRLQKAMKDTGKEYLLLNRGVNSVVNIDLKKIVSDIDFNSNNIQVYPGPKGKIELRKAINDEYFDGKADLNHILISGGGISGLDICMQTIDVSEIVLPAFYWGTYTQLTDLRNIKTSNYESYSTLFDDAASIKGKAVVICDPGNPLGEKHPDEKLLSLIVKLNDNGVIVLFDSPYRRLFYDKSDTLYQSLSKLENVIVIESFSKSLGLSGQRIGFIYNCNESFIQEAGLRLMYASNGINSFAQVIVSKLLTSEDGIHAVKTFKRKTVLDIEKNIAFLKKNDLLAKEFYKESDPVGIFAVLNVSPEVLFDHRIGSVGLDYFVSRPFKGIENYSRILVSYPHEKFVSFFQSLL